MRLVTRLALLGMVVAPIAASADDSPHVTVATPGIGGGTIERFTLRFSEPMFALGDPRAASPVSNDCAIAGAGRWADQQTYVHAFAKGLPGGTRCAFDLIDGLKSARGFAVVGQRHFTVDAGGPTARAVLAGDGGEIEEDQVFLVAANMAPSRNSLGAAAYCAVDGIGERIPVDVLDAGLPGKLLADLGTRSYAVSNFLEQAGLPATIPANATDARAMLAAVVALKCHRPLPPGRDMTLVWGAGIAGAGGKAAGADQKFFYTVRKPFTARFECTRTNADAGCSPVEMAWVRFAAPIPFAQASAIRLELPDGTRIAPKFEDRDKNRATLSDIVFAPPLPSGTPARLMIPAGIRDESGRALANAERFPLDVRFDAAPPLVKFAGAFGIVEAAEGGILPVTVRNVETALQGRSLPIAGQSLRVGGSDSDIARWLRAAARAGEHHSHDERRGRDTVTINDTGANPILSESTGSPLAVPLPGRGRDFEVVGIALKQPGFYVVELASPLLGAALLGRRAPRYVASTALVTNMAVHFKWGHAASLAWVTALDTGKPVAGADVQVTDSCTGTPFARGRTDEQGRLLLAHGLPAPETYADCPEPGGAETGNAHPLMISARKGGDMSFTLTQWGEGIRPDDFDLPYGYEPRGEIFHTVFDRALVRQGETLNMKHIVRQPVAQGFARGSAFTGTLTLVHRGSDTSFELPLSIDANGVGETRWTAPKAAPMGDYDIRAEHGDTVIDTGQSVRIDEYRLPTMRASVTGPKAPPVRPKTVPLDLFAGFLSGGGAANLPVDLRVAWLAHGGAPPGYEAYNFGGRAVHEGTQPMNGDGEEAQTPLPPTQSLPLKLGRDGTAHTSIDVPQNLEGTTDMVIEMDYQDANGEVLTAASTLPIFSAAVQLGMKTDGWLMKQDDMRLRFVTLDAQGKPLAGQKIAVALYSRTILTARRRLIGGFYAYDNHMKTSRLGATCSATSDAQGLAQCALNPGVSGEVYAVATIVDAQGNTARAVQSVWLAGDDEWWFGGDNGDRMDLVPERTEYRAGETAKFQVRMPFRRATALVTVEREGVLASFVTELSGSDPVVAVKLPGSYAPDVFVSVLAVRGRVQPGVWDWLTRLGHALGLAAAPDPAPPATALVDLSKPAYRLGIAKVKVGWEANRLGVTVKADRERYAARDVAQVDVAVARPGGKPAASADLAFVAVDEALLQLAPNRSWDILSAMMGDRALSVLTSTAQTQVVGKRHYGKKAVAAGGGGGAGDSSGLNRENFQPVLLWRGHVPLDAKGQARIAVPLSDALSSFKLVAIATGEASLFGTGEANIRATQDLSIFAGIPPIARTGDQFGAIFTLRNGATTPMTVTARVELTPAIATGKPLTVTIPAGGAVPVVWNLAAREGLSSLRWHVMAKSADGKAVDQISVDQQIIPAVPTEIWAATLARVGADTRIPIARPLGALAGRGMVDIRLSDTLAPPLAGVRAYMTDYPYDCFEQRLSRVVVLGDAAGWTALSGDIPTYQAPDGLLRYWPSDSLDGSAALTAYVLSLTSEAGLAIPAVPRARMVEALRAVVDGRLAPERFGDQRLWRLAAFTALARGGAATPAMLGQIGMTPAEMPTAQLADYLVALDRVAGLANGPALKGATQAALRTRLVFEGTRLDLSDEDSAAWWLMSSSDEAAIKTLNAVLGRAGWQDDAARMMVGTAMRQQRGHWDTTTANAWGTIAARRFAALYPASAISGATMASLGGETRTRAWPLAEPARLLSLPLPRGPAPLRLTQTGGAGPWAMVSVSAAVPLSQPLAAGYTLTKKVEVVQARTKGVMTRGDVLRVTLTVAASAERNWVVVNDPVPAGATIINDAGGQSALLARSGGTQPSYVERGGAEWRGYYAWVPRGTFSVSYSVRLNSAGRFVLPPSRVEAMYSPAIHAAIPNTPITVRLN